MSDSLSTQVGGDHYRGLPIQPTEFCQRNRLGWCEANVVKYVSRHKCKNGRQDIEKAIHYLQILLEIEYPENKASEPEGDLEPRMPAPEFSTYDGCGNMIPKELLPLPPLPEGYDRWVYRGRGYKSEGSVLCALSGGEDDHWFLWKRPLRATGNYEKHYLEAIKDPC